MIPMDPAVSLSLLRDVETSGIYSIRGGLAFFLWHIYLCFELTCELMRLVSARCGLKFAALCACVYASQFLVASCGYLQAAYWLEWTQGWLIFIIIRCGVLVTPFKVYNWWTEASPAYYIFDEQDDYIVRGRISVLHLILPKSTWNYLLKGRRMIMFGGWPIIELPGQYCPAFGGPDPDIPTPMDFAKVAEKNHVSFQSKEVKGKSVLDFPFSSVLSYPHVSPPGRATSIFPMKPRPGSQKRKNAKCAEAKPRKSITSEILHQVGEIAMRQALEFIISELF